MRNKKLTALAAAAILLFSGCATFSLGSENDRVITIYKGQPDTDDSASGEKFGAEEVYQELVNAMQNYQDTITFNADADFDDIDLALNNVIRRNPELFWISGYDASSNSKKTEIVLKILDSLSVDDRIRMQSELDDAANRIISMLPATGDDFDKVVFVHDYIIDHTDYDDIAAMSTQMDMEGTAYGCLVNGDAVCQGYAEAFLYIMNKIGIKCGIVSGNTADGHHAWNYVYVNGGCYWIDLTWDDPSGGNAGEKYLSHTYCLINDDLLLRTRDIDYNFGDVPVCNSMIYNYFVRKNSYFYTYDKALAGEAVIAGASGRSAEMMFASKASLDEAVDRLFRNGEVWELSDVISHDDNVAYSADDNMYVLRFSY